jgi:hypothetical protein
MKAKQLWIAVTFLTLSLAFAGCKDECKDVDCGNGTCDEGVCTCNDYYTGTNCNVAHNAALVGTYTLTGTCTTSGVYPYEVVLAPKPGSPNEATINGMYDSPGHTVTMVISKDGRSFTIAKQASGTSGYWIETTAPGSISADGKTLNMAFNVYHQGGATLLESCSAPLTR